MKGLPAHFESHPQFSSVTAGWRIWPMKTAAECYWCSHPCCSKQWAASAAVRCSCGFVLSVRPQAFPKVAATGLHRLSLAVMKLSQSTSNQAYQSTMRVRTSLSICAHWLKLAAFTWMPLSRSTPNASRTELYQRRFTGPSNSWSGDKWKVCCF